MDIMSDGSWSDHYSLMDMIVHVHGHWSIDHRPSTISHDDVDVMIDDLRHEVGDSSYSTVIITNSQQCSRQLQYHYTNSPIPILHESCLKSKQQYGNTEYLIPSEEMI